MEIVGSFLVNLPKNGKDTANDLADPHPNFQPKLGTLAKLRYPKAPPLVALYLLFEVSDAPLLSMFRIEGRPSPLDISAFWRCCKNLRSASMRPWFPKPPQAWPIPKPPHWAARPCIVFPQGFPQLQLCGWVPLPWVAVALLRPSLGSRMGGLCQVGWWYGVALQCRERPNTG